MSFLGYILAQLTVPADETVSATNGGGGPTTVAITAGTYTLVSLCAHLQAQLDATRPGSGGATWSVTADTATGLVTIAMSAGTFSITLGADLAELLGHATVITTQPSVTGASAARGIWIPDCPLVAQLDQRTNPRRSDLRQQMTPTGRVIGLVGNHRYRHPGLRWSHVARARTWAVDASVPSWERFVLDTQLGDADGHAWFTPSSRVYVYDQTGLAIGSDQAVLSWQLTGVNGTDEVRRSQGSDHINTWWAIEIPELVSDGST